MINKKRGETKSLFSWILVIAIYILLIVMLVAVAFLFKYKTMLSTDPLSYGMKVHHFDYCTCVDADGHTWYSNNYTGFKTTYGEDFDYNKLKVDDFFKNGSG